MLAVLKSVRSIAKKSINVKFKFKFYQKNITASSSTVLTNENQNVVDETSK